MGSISIPAALIGGAALSAGAATLGGINSANAAESAANTQAAAANNATQSTLNMFNINQANLKPYQDLGTASLPQLTYALGLGQLPAGTNAPPGISFGELTKGFAPTMTDLAKTPGYQFTLGQGLQATQNSYASQGLAGSGAALKGAANYAEGLAGTTYQQNFNNYWTNELNKANLLSGPVNTGVNAAGSIAGLGANATQAANNFATSGAAASAAGTIGSANAINNALGGVSSSASNYALLSGLNNSGLFGNSTNALSAGLVAGSAPNIPAGAEWTNNLAG